MILLDTDILIDLISFMKYRLSHNTGMLDMLIGHTAISLGTPLYTFNERHYNFITGIQTIQPYIKNV